MGDDAIWVSELKALDAHKNDLLCVVSLAGSALVGHYDGLPQKLSDFATRSLRKSQHNLIASRVCGPHRLPKRRLAPQEIDRHRNVRGERTIIRVGRNNFP